MKTKIFHVLCVGILFGISPYARTVSGKYAVKTTASSDMRASFYSDTIKKKMQLSVLPGGSAVTPTVYGKILNDVLGHSPEAEAMVKNTLMPVSLYTGMPQVTVPVFEIKGKSITIPIALNYNYNGYKPNEIAGAAGLGWSVQGGGVITRIVKGTVDHENTSVGSQSGDYDGYADISILINNRRYAREFMADGLIDGQPDVFVFNSNGLSGKFIMLHGKAYLFPHQNITIKPSGSGFEITKENGDRYTFDQEEFTHHDQIDGSDHIDDHVSAWHLSSIISADRADTIRYTYTDGGYQQPGLDIEQYTMTYSHDHPVYPIHEWTIMGANADYIDTKVLAGISYKNTNIQLNGTGEELGSIVITSTLPTSTFTKTYSLVHATLNGKMNLMRVDISGSDTTTVQQYKFEYEDGSVDLGPYYAWGEVYRSIDEYGYYNGASNSGKILFGTSFPSAAPYVNGSRASNFTYCKINTIKKLTYPTGGYNTFEFEQNKLGSSDGPGVRVKKISFFDNIDDVDASLVKEYKYAGANSSYTSFMTGQTITTWGESCGNLNYDKSIFQTSGTSLISDLLNTAFYYNNITEVNRSATATGSTLYEYRSYDQYDPDIYLYQKTDSIMVGSSLTPVKQLTNSYDHINRASFTAVSVSLDRVAQSPEEGEFCGGVPNNDLADLDAGGGTQLGYRIEGYGLASGFNLLQYTKEKEWDQNGIDTQSVYTYYYYDNPDHNYPTRTITNNSKGERLTTYTKYPLDYLPSTCSSRYDIDTTFFGKKFRTYKAYEGCYTNLVSYAGTPGYATRVAGAHCEDSFHVRTLRVYAERDSAWARHYRALDDAQIANSSNWQGSLAAMMGKNIFSNVIEQYTTVKKSDANEYIIAATKNDYLLQSFDGESVPKLAAVRQAEISGSVLKSSFLADTATYYRTQSLMKYNTALNLEAQWKNNDVKQTYIWAYNNQYPVAGVANASTSDIAYSSFESDGKGEWSYSSAGITGSYGAVTGKLGYVLGTENMVRSGLSNVKTYVVSFWVYKESGVSVRVNGEIPTLLVEKNNWELYRHVVTGASSVTVSGTGTLDEVRLYPQNAQMTTFTYDPLKGISSQCDINNRITYYEYDSFNRLKLVRDHDRNILKTVEYKYQQAQ